MSRLMKKAGGLALGLGVTGALAFGATVAFARPANAMTCANDGWNFLGAQPSLAACTSACLALHQDLIKVRWGPNNCCTCFF